MVLCAVLWGSAPGCAAHKDDGVVWEGEERPGTAPSLPDDASTEEMYEYIKRYYFEATGRSQDLAPMKAPWFDKLRFRQGARGKPYTKFLVLGRQDAVLVFRDLEGEVATFNDGAGPNADRSLSSELAALEQEIRSVRMGTVAAQYMIEYIDAVAQPGLEDRCKGGWRSEDEGVRSSLPCVASEALFHMQLWGNYTAPNTRVAMLVVAFAWASKWDAWPLSKTVPPPLTADDYNTAVATMHALVTTCVAEGACTVGGEGEDGSATANVTRTDAILAWPEGVRQSIQTILGKDAPVLKATVTHGLVGGEPAATTPGSEAHTFTATTRAKATATPEPEAEPEPAQRSTTKLENVTGTRRPRAIRFTITRTVQAQVSSFSGGMGCWVTGNASIGEPNYFAVHVDVACPMNTTAGQLRDPMMKLSLYMGSSTDLAIQADTKPEPISIHIPCEAHPDNGTVHCARMWPAGIDVNTMPLDKVFERNTGVLSLYENDVRDEEVASELVAYLVWPGTERGYAVSATVSSFQVGEDTSPQPIDTTGNVQLVSQDGTPIKPRTQDAPAHNEL